MKTTGALWNEYMASWPEGQYYDYSDETADGKEIDGNDEVDPRAVVEFSCGVVFADGYDREGVDLPRHFSAWLKRRDTTAYLVEVKKGRENEFVALLKAHGFKGRKA